MKRNLLLSVAFILSISTRSFAQDLGDNFYTLNFEDTAALHHLIIDASLNHNNLWQVGAPNKAVFTSAYFSPNAIVTDTLNSYPVNDTSSFEIMNVVSNYGWIVPYVAILSADYQVNSDSLTDNGKIEVSLDNGNTWIDINEVQNDTYLGWESPIPILSGNSNGWHGFQINLAGLGPMFGVQFGDTIRYRITFISDSIQTNKDGLMFDNFHFEDWVEGIQEEVQNDNLISLSPNPVQNLLTINLLSPSAASTIAVYDVQGRKIVLPTTLSNNKAELNTTTLPNGIYLLQIINIKTGESEVGKFVKEK